MGWVCSKDGYNITRNSVTAGDRRAVTELCCHCHVTQFNYFSILYTAERGIRRRPYLPNIALDVRTSVCSSQVNTKLIVAGCCCLSVCLSVTCCLHDLFCRSGVV
jgi:hypothetical protein